MFQVDKAIEDMKNKSERIGALKLLQRALAQGSLVIDHFMAYVSSQMLSICLADHQGTHYNAASRLHFQIVKIPFNHTLFKQLKFTQKIKSIFLLAIN